LQFAVCSLRFAVCGLNPLVVIGWTISAVTNLGQTEQRVVTPLNAAFVCIPPHQNSRTVLSEDLWLVDVDKIGAGGLSIVPRASGHWCKLQQTHLGCITPTIWVE